MNIRYNTLAIVGLLLLGANTPTYSQQVENNDTQQLESAARKVAELSAVIVREANTSIHDIDFSELVRESEKVARLSATNALKIAQDAERAINVIDFDELHNELAKIHNGIGNLDLSSFGEEKTTISSAAYREEKVIEKVYRIGGKDRLTIDNRYGTIKVSNWNRNEFKVVVRVKVGESSERRAREALERVSISDTKTGNEVRFVTSISAAESGWFSSLTGGNRSQELSVNYEVFMPAANELSLSNQYGAIETGDREGKLNVSVNYGSLKTGRLGADNNVIAANYSNVNISSAQGAEISVNYGGLTLGEIGTASISMNYSGNGKITSVNQSADISLRYSSGVSIGLGSGIKNANISASYSSVSVSPARNAAFNFNTAVSYGSFNYGPNATVSEANDSSNSKQYSGYWNSNSQNNVNIKARYGSITLK